MDVIFDDESLMYQSRYWNNSYQSKESIRNSFILYKFSFLYWCFKLFAFTNSLPFDLINYVSTYLVYFFDYQISDWELRDQASDLILSMKENGEYIYLSGDLTIFKCFIDGMCEIHPLCVSCKDRKIVVECWRCNIVYECRDPCEFIMCMYSNFDAYYDRLDYLEYKI